MVPTTWLALIFFAVLIAPGLLFDLLSERRRAGVPESTFREASRVVLASVVFSGLAALILRASDSGQHVILSDAAAALVNASSYVSAHFALTVRWLIVQVAVSLLLALLAHRLFSWLHGGATIRQMSAWTKLFKVDPPSDTVPFARVRTEGGRVYAGFVVHGSPDLEIEDREIVLAVPFTSVDGKLSRLPDHYRRVWIKGDTIELITVAWESPPAGAKLRPRPRLPRIRTLLLTAGRLLLG